MQNKSVKNWIDCWKAWKEPDNRINKLGPAELLKKRDDDVAKKTCPVKKRKPGKEIFNILEEAGFHANGARVLDIGCVPGTCPSLLPMPVHGSIDRAEPCTEATKTKIRNYYKKKQWTGNILPGPVDILV